MARSRSTLASLAVAAAALSLAACGSSSSKSGGGGGGSNAGVSTQGTANVTPSADQKRGGTLNVTSSETFQHLDPGQAYFQLDYGVTYATQRPLYSFKPDDPVNAQPDLAAGPPQVSADGKTVTITIKPNVKYSPPVNRTVTSADVKYAIERGFNPNVNNGYASSYFGTVVGAPAKPKVGATISGITTPNPTTIVFKLTSNFGATMAKALSLPLSAPVPKDYAGSFDKKSPAKYESDPTKQAFTGPYVISAYNAGSGVTLTRNPNWDPKTDFRPAYADQIVWKTGGDAGVVARQTLAGKDTVMMDAPPAPLIKQTFQQNKAQITFSPLGERYVALNTQKPPFDNVNIRKAVIAATNKVAMNQVRGGAVIGVPGTHFLTPGQPGYQESGGDKGFGLDFMDTPNGNAALAASYMKKAGFPSGKYTGGAQVSVVGSNEGDAPKSTQLFGDGLRSLGFNVKPLNVPQATMYSKFCQVPKSAPSACSTVGWLPDFPDGYANLYVTFNGKTISPASNNNWPQLNVPAIDAAMDKAGTIADPTQRNQAWAQVNRMITEQAPAVVWQWSKDALVESKATHGVVAKWNAVWDLAFSSTR